MRRSLRLTSSPVVLLISTVVTIVTVSPVAIPLIQEIACPFRKKMKSTVGHGGKLLALAEGVSCFIAAITSAWIILVLSGNRVDSLQIIIV